MLGIMNSWIDERFNQDTISLINTIDNLIKLKICIIDLRLFCMPWKRPDHAYDLEF